mmetsp:Transcript_106794/g.297262  ORF Transcript_106794/g.297262 Transcript_106794/m.297262 type:complete len:781 (-) Transcript_106794:63-2405(-)
MGAAAGSSQGGMLSACPSIGALWLSTRGTTHVPVQAGCLGRASWNASRTCSSSGFIFGVGMWGRVRQAQRRLRSCGPRTRAEAWGRRAEGRRRQSPSRQLSRPQHKLKTIDRPMRQDLGDMIDAGADRALQEGRMAEEGVREVLVEAAVLASKGVQEPAGRMEKRVRKDIERTVSPEDRPQFFPHFRKLHGFDEQQASGDGGETGVPKCAPDHFFSQKTWDAVYGISDDIVELTAALQLPRPSRIQNLTFHDIARGRNTVIADQAGSGKTLAYLLPLLKRHVFGSREGAAQLPSRIKLLVLAPTSDLAEQILNVARVVSARSACQFRVHCCTGVGRAYTQRGQLAAGTDMLIATPGRLRWLLLEDPTSPLDLSECGAVVFDEVDVLVKDDVDLSVEDLSLRLPTRAQWVFVTATLAEVARQQLEAFEALPSQLVEQEGVATTQRARLVWHSGPGLHRVSPRCEHVLVDCTPLRLHQLPPNKRHKKVMREKILALAWHLKHGVLREEEEDRVVVFCNTIANCQMVENELRKLDPKDRRSGSRRWKVLVLHGNRDKQDYRQLAAEFSGERVKARDFFKKKVMVCTDRLSRGMDFSQQPVNWVVLLDWPRDATEYLRRVGRTARGGGRGGVLSCLAGLQELRMAKQVTSAAVRSLPLQGGAAATGALTEKAFCLERFDPTAHDWRSCGAAAPRPRGDPGGGASSRGGEAAEGSGVAPTPAWHRAEAWREAEEEAAQEDAGGMWAPWAEGKRGELLWDENDDWEEEEEEGMGLSEGTVGVSLRE